MTNRNEDDEAKPIGDSLADALNRLGQHVRANARKKAEADATAENHWAALVSFDPAKLEQVSLLFEDTAGEEDAGRAYMDANKLLTHYREWHRHLSEQIVSANRELAKLAAKGQELRSQVEEWQAKRSEVEADIEAEDAQLKALARAPTTIVGAPWAFLQLTPPYPFHSARISCAALRPAGGCAVGASSLSPPALRVNIIQIC